MTIANLNPNFYKKMKCNSLLENITTPNQVIDMQLYIYFLFHDCFLFLKWFINEKIGIGVKRQNTKFKSTGCQCKLFQISSGAEFW